MRWLNSEQARIHLGLPTRKALYERVRRGQVPVHKLGRSLRFNSAELDQVLATGVTPLDRAVRSALRRPSAQEKGEQ